MNWYEFINCGNDVFKIIFACLDIVERGSAVVSLCPSKLYLDDFIQNLHCSFYALGQPRHIPLLFMRNHTMVDRNILINCAKINEHAIKDSNITPDVILEVIKDNVHILRVVDKITDYNYATTLVKLNGEAITYFQHLIDDKMITQAVKTYPMAVKYGVPSYQILLQAVQMNPRAYIYVGEFCSDKFLAKQAVKQWGNALFYTSDELKLDKEIVKAAVISNASAIEHAPFFHDVEEIMAIAVGGHPALIMASEEIKANREIVLDAVLIDGTALKYAPTFKDEQEIVLAAIKQNGMALKYASDRLCDSKEIAIQAITNNIIAYAYISDRLSIDEDICLKTLKLYNQSEESKCGLEKNILSYVFNRLSNACQPYAIMYLENGVIYENSLLEVSKLKTISKNYKYANREIIKQLAAAENKHYNYTSFAIDKLEDNLQNDSELICELIRLCEGNIKNIVPEMLEKREISMQLVKSNIYTLQEIPTIWRYDRDFILEAVQNIENELLLFNDWRYSQIENYPLFLAEKPSLQEDKELVISLMKVFNCFYFREIRYRYKEEQEVIIEAMKYLDVEENISSTKHHAYFFWNRIKRTSIVRNKEVALQVLSINPSALWLFSEILDYELLFQLLSKNILALKYISESTYISDNLKFKLSSNDGIIYKACSVYNGYLLEHLAIDKINSVTDIALDKGCHLGYLTDIFYDNNQNNNTLKSLANGRFTKLIENSDEFYYLCDDNEIKSNRDLVKKSTEKDNGTIDNLTFLCQVSDDLQSDGALLISMYQHLEDWLTAKIPEFMYSRYDLIAELLHLNGNIIRYLPEELKGNKEFALKAVKSGVMLCSDNYDSYVTEECILCLFTNELRADKELGLQSVKYFSFALQFLSNELQDDEEIVEMALNPIDKIKRDWMYPQSYSTNLLKYISKRLQNKIEIVLPAIKLNPLDLEYASPELRNNLEVVSLAITKNPLALQYASSELRNNLQLVTLAIAENPLVLQYASPELRNNLQLVTLAIAENPLVLQYASGDLKNNKKLVRRAIKVNAEALQFASSRLRNNFELVSLAVKIYPYSYSYVSTKMKYDSRIIEYTLRQPELLEIMSLDIQQHYQEDSDSDSDIVNQPEPTWVDMVKGI